MAAWRKFRRMACALKCFSRTSCSFFDLTCAENVLVRTGKQFWPVNEDSCGDGITGHKSKSNMVFRMSFGRNILYLGIIGLVLSTFLQYKATKCIKNLFLRRHSPLLHSPLLPEVMCQHESKCGISEKPCTKRSHRCTRSIFQPCRYRIHE